MISLLIVSLVGLGCGRAMSDDVDKLLETEDDFELCDGLFKRLIKHHGEDLDVAKCKDKDQTVLLVWHAAGIIDNGGFQFLFEGNFKGDFHFAKTAAAFKTIQAAKCAAAIDDALKLFPNSKPPADIEKRLKLYQSASAAKRRAIDEKFFSESKGVKTLLANYIRANRDDFKHLK
jgi:hypothetical protein